MFLTGSMETWRGLLHFHLNTHIHRNVTFFVHKKELTNEHGLKGRRKKKIIALSLIGKNRTEGYLAFHPPSPHTCKHTHAHFRGQEDDAKKPLSLLYPYTIIPMIRIGPERYGRGDGDGSSSAEQTEPGLHDPGGCTRLPPGAATRVAYPESWPGGTRRDRHVRRPSSPYERRRRPDESREELQRPAPRPPR